MSNEPIGFEEKRASLRVDMEAERVLLHWIDANGQPQEDAGICIDLARKGILIDYKAPFALGDLIAVTFNHNTDKQNTIKGQVCRCLESNPQSYHIAMQLL
ncbi:MULTISPECIES: PilZ domain-containing protein [unclassified Shewanella]|uniref:PilZ domain-containing protein n=1 Tax=unclassified Shewanella TaxID=196818 RepID=UPI000C836BE4|nr:MULTISPECIES: PilZ domain-containing protein [unclassified Shewanella]MDO6619459.1 PilZ domain-containing protein [Shewanella sp. 6_MG-2023]MDO6639413.1 PilZ domain-containing protein [Shewanella sp. 5_MG-2023]MDO6678174.1 PilZ domain-containing protein [Shewanella sp. 4_MG-2023]MDO6775913.1 PilZ domain-containing protein [Shewanella sp. 3_MG-2023]PMG30302.1 pilus assembly protein PilZ [Shewanella sp. 10N.286.52.C2]